MTAVYIPTWVIGLIILFVGWLIIGGGVIVIGWYIGQIIGFVLLCPLGAYECINPDWNPYGWLR